MIVISLFSLFKSLFKIIITNDLFTYFGFLAWVAVNRIKGPWGLLNLSFENP
jgi:hypothetical protein